MVIANPENKYQVVYAAFDRIEVAFKCWIPPELIEIIDKAKIRAQENNQESLIDFNGLSFKVAASGTRMFRYLLDTGLDGEKIFLRGNKNVDWNCRVVVKSAAFISNNFGQIKARLYARLDQLGIKIAEESIGRVDFAVDFVTDRKFKINHQNIVCHAHSNVKGHGGKSLVDVDCDEETGVVEFYEEWSGGRCTGVTIGKMPNKQLCCYDKRKEVIQKKKEYWFDVWGVDRDDKEKTVWRFEMRAGKDHLKRRWRVTTFNDIEEKLGAIFLETIKSIRLLDDMQTDSNRTRAVIHPIWREMEKTIEKIFTLSARYTRDDSPIRAEREQVIAQYQKQLCGMISGFASVYGLDKADIEDIPKVIAQMWLEQYQSRPQRVLQSYMAAQERYYFYDNTAHYRSRH